jgi:hypothetical protein
MLNCISEFVQVIEGRIHFFEGRMLASPDLKAYLNNSKEDK